MEPIISPWIVYLIHVASVISFVSTLIAIFSGLGVALTAIFLVIEDKDLEIGNMRKALKVSTIVFAISVVVSIIVPDRETMLAILTLSFVTPDNITLVQDNLVDFIQRVVEACRGVK